MAKPTLYLFRGRSTWQVSRLGMPEDEDLLSGAVANPRTAVPTPFPREMDVEAALRATRNLYPTHDVRILNWHRPKRDV
jgi:hypothetical protein